MGDGIELSYALYKDLRDNNDVFAGMFCRFPVELQISQSGRGERLLGELVSGTYFPAARRHACRRAVVHGRR